MKTDGSERKISIFPPSDHLEQTISETLSEILKQWRRKLGYYSLFAAVPAMLAGSTNDARAENALIPEAKTSGREAGILGKRKKGTKRPPFYQMGANRLAYQKARVSLFPNLLAGGNDDCPGEAIPNGTYTAASPYTDTGDTSGANNTVNRVYYYGWYYYYYYYYYAAYGPDRVYSFNVHNLGANPQIQITTTSATYRPMVYLLTDEGGCPAGTDNDVLNQVTVNDSRWGSGNTATVTIPTWSGSRMYHLFVDSSVAGDAGAYTVRIQDVEVGPNRAPTANDDSFNAYQDSEWNIDVLSNDTDPDKNWLTVSAVTQGNNGSVVNDGRYIRYTPNPGFTGSDTFTYTLSDGQGGSDTATVTVTVSPNSRPVANDDVAEVGSGPNNINVLANDSDPDGNTISISSVTQGSNGVVYRHYLGSSLFYDPNPGFTGVDTFTYTISDGRGGSDTATVTVTVLPNRAPIANDDTALVTQNSGSNSINVLANDTDPDSNPLSISGVTQGSNGSVVNNMYGVTYTPNAGFSGVDTFTYTIADGEGGAATATVSVRVVLNAALPANGGTALASSTYSSSFPASGANNGDRKGLSWGSSGGWNDATANAFPDWLEISFNGLKSISKVDVFTVQDGYQNPAEPYPGMTFSRYGITAFDIQYWNGSDWVTAPAGNITNNNQIWRSLTLTSPVETTGIRIRVNSSMASYSRIAEVEAWGLSVQVPVDPRINAALAANGATVSASSTYSSSFPAGSTIDGDRRGLNWGSGGGWNDATANSQPDSLEVAFNGEQTINEIDIFTLQDNYQNPSQPSESMTFSQYGITAFDVQYWNGTSWVLVPGGSITGNNLVWRKLTFDPVRTSKIRVVVNGALAAYSRIVEVEAWTTTDDPPDPPPPPPPGERMNFALSANGGTASASSTFSSSFPTAGAINGDRKGSGWGNGGGWNDSSASSYPDWLQIDFNGTKMIDEIDVFTLQDNYQNPSEPTESSTFTQYGITSFNVQYWDGSSWITVPGGSITNNNKVWTKLTFSPIQTTRIRILVNSSLLIYSRIVEVEAHGTT